MQLVRIYSKYNELKFGGFTMQETFVYENQTGGGIQWLFCRLHNQTYSNAT